MLRHIEIEAVRNLSNVSVEISSGATILHGSNGSGKTSFLEALHLLGVGRSFRTNQARPVIQHGVALCRVVGQLSHGGYREVLGIERDFDGGVRARVGGESVSSLSELARQLPLVLLDTDGVGVLTGPPERRRRLIDGTLFHVEPSFLELWRRYQLAVRQRNGGLRHGILDSDIAWRAEIADIGEKLTAIRAAASEEIGARLVTLSSALSADLEGLNVRFRSGWDRKESLFEALERNVHSDVSQGFTQIGPHRADLRFTLDGVAVSSVLSRGQLKLLLVALRLIQGQMIEAVSQRRPLYLVDDLPAELDAEHCASVCRQLSQDRQVVLTAVDRGSLESAWGDAPADVFHVERGRVIKS